VGWRRPGVQGVLKFVSIVVIGVFIISEFVEGFVYLNFTLMEFSFDFEKRLFFDCFVGLT
jgi:hypothetical protein